MKGVALLLLIVFSQVGFSQIPPFSLTHQAVSRINKSEWAKAEQLLQKSIRKEPSNPEVNFVFSQFYLSPANPKLNIDSSAFYLKQAVNNYANVSNKEKARLKRFLLDTLILKSFRLKIDSAAFARAQSQNTEASYTYFIEHFSTAIEMQRAIVLRDEVAFKEAQRKNTYRGFQEYLQKYPNATKALEAKTYYEKLWFADQTKDGKLASYSSFLKTYPSTSYKNEIERNIFEMSTASGTIESFQEFIASYPTSKYCKKAINLLFYLKEDTSYLTDSLKEIAAANKGFWVPFLKDGKFGFIDQTGNETIAPRLDFVDGMYLCGNVTADLFITSKGLMARNGQILDSHVTAMEELGMGFLKIQSGNCWRVIHKSGFPIGSGCIENAKVVGNHFLALKELSRWKIFSLTGKQLSATSFDDISGEDELIVFSRAGKKSLKTQLEVAELANNTIYKETLVFDHVRSLGQGYYQVSNGSLQGVVSNKLHYVVPLDRQLITQTPHGFLQQRNKKFNVTGISKEVDSKEYVSVSFYNDWAKLTEKNNLTLYDVSNKKIIDEQLDSIWFENKLAFALKNDSITVHLSKTNFIRFGAAAEIKFIKSKDTIRYFYAGNKQTKTIIEIATGKKLFSTKAIVVEYIGYGVFLMENEDKKGLVSTSGKLLLPYEYNAIVPSGQKYVSLLKDKKFGLFELTSKALIKPAYERNLFMYSKQKLVAFKNGGYGFVSWALKEESKFEFDEIIYWNDSVALVKQNAYWMLYHINKKKPIITSIKDVQYIKNTEEEKLAIIHQDTFYGVISNRNGTLLASHYNDVINLGSEDMPLYFTEKYVAEADIHVVIYYNWQGKMIKKQAYETDAYEKILCDQN